MTIELNKLIASVTLIPGQSLSVTTGMVHYEVVKKHFESINLAFRWYYVNGTHYFVGVVDEDSQMVRAMNVLAEHDLFLSSDNVQTYTDHSEESLDSVTDPESIESTSLQAD